MRLSSAQIFQQGIDAIVSQQAKLDSTQQQLASGKKLLSPADDPVVAVQALNVAEDLDSLDQYQRNSTLAETQLALTDTTLDRVGSVLQRARELIVQANNASQSPDTRRGIAAELSGRLDELLALANTSDANGEYIFAGYQSKTEPFVKQGTSVSYRGDDGQRFLQVSDNTQVAVRNPGTEVFERLRAGNGVFEVSASSANTGVAVVGQTQGSTSYTPATYTVVFSQSSPADPVLYEVIDAASSVVASGTYAAGDTIDFAGASITFTGDPADGDSFSVLPAQNKSLFERISGLVEQLNGVTAAPESVAQLNTVLSQGLTELDSALDNVLRVRADVGVRQQQVDAQLILNENFTIRLQEALSEMQDLDYAEAISRFNLELTALQAAQQAYTRMQSMSLFNYL